MECFQRNLFGLLFLRHITSESSSRMKCPTRTTPEHLALLCCWEHGAKTQPEGQGITFPVAVTRETTHTSKGFHSVLQQRRQTSY